MFTELNRLEHKRTFSQAFGFYVSYLGMIMLASGIFAEIASLLMNPPDPYTFGVGIGIIVSSLFSFILPLRILKQKNIHPNALFFILSLCSGFLAFIFGGIVGLIFSTYLTTLPSKHV